MTWKHVLLGVGGRATFATAWLVGRTLVRMAIGPFVPGVNQAGPGCSPGYSSPINPTCGPDPPRRLARRRAPLPPPAGRPERATGRCAMGRS